MRLLLPWRRGTAVPAGGLSGHHSVVVADGRTIDPDDLERVLVDTASIEDVCVVTRPTESGGAGVCIVAVPATSLVLRCADDPATVERTIREEVDRLVGGLLPAMEPASVYLHPVPLPRTSVARRRRLVGSWLETLERISIPAIGAVPIDDATTAPPPSSDEARQTDATFRREGEYWTIVYSGSVCRLKDSRGLHYVAHLLRHPGREFHALDLTAMVGGGSGRRDARQRDGEALLDAPAKAAYGRRLDELREELNEAERFNDAGRAARARDELEVLTEHLAGAVGLGGRDRMAASDAERARVAVTQGIRTAIKRVAEGIPALGDHLARSIKTGTFCVYAPGPSHPVTWTL